MMDFGSLAVAVVEEFAASLGLPAAPARDGSYGFLFERSGLVSFTVSATGKHMLISLAWRPAHRDAPSDRRLLDLGGLDASTGKALHVGLAPDNHYVCAIALVDSELDLSSLDLWLQRLIAIRDMFP